MHRKLRALLLAAALSCLWAGVALAASTTGKMARIDLMGMTFVLNDGDEDLLFWLRGDTEVMEGDRTSSLRVLQAGDEIRVEYAEQGGKRVAARIDRTKAAPASGETQAN